LSNIFKFFFLSEKENTGRDKFPPLWEAEGKIKERSIHPRPLKSKVLVLNLWE
jgi:hypothetical protein